MSIKARYISLAVLIFIVIGIFFLVTIKVKNSSDEIIVNEKIIETRGFSISSDSTELNTSVKGTVFIKGAKKNPEHVQIVAWIDIDPNDWGGVAFYIPNGWHISNITSSYPENETQAIPADYVATWASADLEHEWNAWIEIGRDHSYIPTGGGIGTVVIDLVLDKNTIQQLETFNIMVGVGSDEKDGVKIEHPDHISIEIPIT